MGDFQPFSENRQHARQYLEPQIFLITQPIRTPLDDADLVIETFNEAERHFVLGLAVSGYALPRKSVEGQVLIFTPTGKNLQRFSVVGVGHEALYLVAKGKT